MGVVGGGGGCATPPPTPPSIITLLMKHSHLYVTRTIRPASHWWTPDRPRTGDVVLLVCVCVCVWAGAMAARRGDGSDRSAHVHEGECCRVQTSAANHVRGWSFILFEEWTQESFWEELTCLQQRAKCIIYIHIYIYNKSDGLGSLPLLDMTHQIHFLKTYWWVQL